MVGAGVRVGVGSGAGVRVGVGSGAGVRVGVGSGAEMVGGAALGDGAGVGEGTGDGATDVSAVRSRVGTAVGVTVGNCVGLKVAAVVGAAGGNEVEVDVGLCEPQATATNAVAIEARSKGYMRLQVFIITAGIILLGMLYERHLPPVRSGARWNQVYAIPTGTTGVRS